MMTDLVSGPGPPGTRRRLYSATPVSRHLIDGFILYLQEEPLKTEGSANTSAGDAIPKMNQAVLGYSVLPD